MTSSVKSLSNAATVMSSGYLDRFIPEPKNRLGVGFRNVLNGISSIFSGAGSQVAGLDVGLQGLLNEQLRAQQQMQLISLHSNIEKSKHESRMAAIRNVRTA